MVHSDSPDTHNQAIDLDNVEATVNAAYGFGASPLAVRNLLFNLSSFFRYL